MTAPALALLLIASGANGAPAASHNDNGPEGITKPPRPGPKFPALESYYPMEARRAGQEGSAIVRVCVDTNGRLTSSPTIAMSSGIEALDAAAVNLANAGSGLYLPGTLNGVPQESCSEFRINFEMRANPLLRMMNFRLPTVKARVEALGSEYGQRLAEVEKTVDKPTPDVLAVADPEAVRAIRQYARALDAALDQAVAMVADLLDDIDYLGHNPDIPENERTAFVAIWPNERMAFAQKFRKTLGESRDVVRSLDELADYISFSNSRRSDRAQAGTAQTPSQDPHLVEIRSRVLKALRKVQGSIDAFNETH